MYVLTYIDPRDGRRHREVDYGDLFSRELRVRDLPRSFSSPRIVPVSAVEHLPLPIGVAW